MMEKGGREGMATAMVVMGVQQGQQQQQEEEGEWCPGRYPVGETSTHDLRGIKSEPGRGKRKRREEKEDEEEGKRAAVEGRDTRRKDSGNVANYESFFQGKHTHGAALKNGKMPIISEELTENKSTEELRVAKAGKSGNVSGRDWKRSRMSRAHMMASNVGKKTSFEKRIEERMRKQAFRKARDEAKELEREEKRVAKEKREEKQRIKEENRKKSGDVVQIITNPNTVKKMMKNKKQRKLLRTV